MPSRKYFAYISKALLLGGVLFFFLFFSYRIQNPRLPTKSLPIHLYSNQTGDDLKKVFLGAIQKAKKSLFLQMYGFTDETLIEKITEASKKGIAIQVFYDPSGSSSLKKKIPEATAIVGRGLMHKKILVLDGKKVFIGTANFTPTSLCMHDNVVIGLYSKEISYFLEKSLENKLFFIVGEQNGELWLLPDFQSQCLTSLLQKIKNATHSIQVALFTFTHPKITQALIEAKSKGVLVEVALDFYSAKGASKKAVEELNKANIPLFISQGGKLLHHKWGIIDGKTLLLGSANWTKSAFEKNEDCLLILNNLNEKQIKYFSKIWKDIKSNCTTKEG